MMTKKEFTNKIKRKAVTFQVGGFRPDDKLTSSWLGKVLLGMPGEAWPQSNGHFMMPMCQLNVGELPYKPQRLHDVAFLTLFMDSQRMPVDAPNGEGWLLRTYAHIDELSPLRSPETKFAIKPFQLRPQVIENDFPCIEDCPEEVPEKFEDEFSDHFPNASGIKVGGWPKLIQSEVFWAPHNLHPAEPEYVFQIDSVEKTGLPWGDQGVVYIGRGTKPGAEQAWCLSWQSL